MCVGVLLTCVAPPNSTLVCPPLTMELPSPSTKPSGPTRIVLASAQRPASSRPRDSVDHAEPSSIAVRARPPRAHARRGGAQRAFYFQHSEGIPLAVSPCFAAATVCRPPLVLRASASRVAVAAAARSSSRDGVVPGATWARRSAGSANRGRTGEARPQARRARRGSAGERDARSRRPIG